MKVIRDINEITYDKGTVLTVGTFDGVHMGHREILNKMLNVKKEKGYRTVVVTFDPHPQIVLKNKAKDIKLLNTTKEKLAAFEECGIDIVLIINFTMDFSRTPAKDFYINYLIKKIGLAELVLGYDHMFGKDREGSFETLRELSAEHDFTVDKVGEYMVEDEHVNSTIIRKLLSEGDVKKAAKLLGYRYQLSGKVIHGDARGREMGFPTANMEPGSPEKMIPKNGIYVVEVSAKGSDLYGMMYIGYNETFTDEKKLKLEVNIFEFDGDVYDEEITLKFIERLRGDQKFSTLEDVKKQIEQDKERSKQIINNLN